MSFKVACDTTAEIEDIKQRCFDRIKFRSISYHKSSSIPFADLADAQLAASWAAAQVAVDPDKLNILPQILSNGNLIDGEPQTEGGDGDFSTTAGTPEVVSLSKPRFQADIKFMNAANNIKINKINTISQNEGVSVFLLDVDDDVIWGYLYDDGSVGGFPIIPRTMSVTQGGGNSGEQTIKKIDGAMPDDWDERATPFSITDLTVQQLLNQQAI